MSEAKKIVLKLDLYDNKCKKKAMTKASGLPGIGSVSLDEDQKLTVIGDVDPVMVVKKLKKLCCTCRADLVSVGPAKEPAKKPDKPPEKKPAPSKDNPPKETVTPTCPCTVICPPPMATCYYPYYCTSYGGVVVEDHQPPCVIL